MDNRKGKASSPSSITSQLFGPPDSSNDVFASIFPPKEPGRNSGCSEVRGSWQKEPSGTGNLNTKQDSSYKHGDANKEKSSIYQQEGEPCYLSSSIYYGGRESYSGPPTHSTSSSYSNFKKDGGEDDPNGAARGNWWQGSLYY